MQCRLVSSRGLFCDALPTSRPSSSVLASFTVAEGELVEGGETSGIAVPSVVGGRSLLGGAASS